MAGGAALGLTYTVSRNWTLASTFFVIITIAVVTSL
jgi:hypothetical protein